MTRFVLSIRYCFGREAAVQSLAPLGGQGVAELLHQRAELVRIDPDLVGQGNRLRIEDQLIEL